LYTHKKETRKNQM